MSISPYVYVYIYIYIYEANKAKVSVGTFALCVFILWWQKLLVAPGVAVPHWPPNCGITSGRRLTRTRYRTCFQTLYIYIYIYIYIYSIWSFLHDGWGNTPGLFKTIPGKSTMQNNRCTDTYLQSCTSCKLDKQDMLDTAAEVKAD